MLFGASARARIPSIVGGYIFPGQETHPIISVLHWIMNNRCQCFHLPVAGTKAYLRTHEPKASTESELRAPMSHNLSASSATSLVIPPCGKRCPESQKGFQIFDSFRSSLPYTNDLRFSPPRMSNPGMGFPAPTLNSNVPPIFYQGKSQ